MVKRGSGVVVRIIFENLTATYTILDIENGNYYRYYGQDYHELEFRLSDYVTFNKLPGIPYVVKVQKYALKVQEIPIEPQKTEDLNLNTSNEN